MYDMLFHPASATDCGTMCSNMNVCHNINAKTKNVLDNFNYCKDFVETETNSFIVVAAMNHFGMKSLKDDDIVPPHICHAQKKDKRVWLHKQVKIILESLVTNQNKEDLDQIINGIQAVNSPTYPCRECGKTYYYRKCRDNHEMKLHPELITSDEDTTMAAESNSEEDHVYNYACVRLSFGMLLRNFSDAVREGDGERIIRCWKFLLLIYRAHNHTKYAYAALHLIANVNAMLTPQQAHSIVWNRTVNNRGTPGSNISLDLRMEHIVHLLKEMMSNLGVNLTPEASLRCSRAVWPVEQMLKAIDNELGCQSPYGKHTVSHSEKNFELIVQELLKEDVFQSKQDHREYNYFPAFKRNLIGNLDYVQLNKWINDHKRKWKKSGH
jgi:serine palmitoyltransferase